MENGLPLGNILYNRGIAFVTYEHEANAQFAKEAMANQSLDMEEVLNVRCVIPACMCQIVT